MYRPGDELTKQIANDLTSEKFTELFLNNLLYSEGTTINKATETEKYNALVRSVKAVMMSRWDATNEATKNTRDSRTVCYLSAEFLMGNQLKNAMLSAHIKSTIKHSLKSLGINIDDLIEHEIEPGLGNGGLGRLAACYIDSLAAHSIPAMGYGIRYEYGIFYQDFDKDGRQVEHSDHWLEFGNPWEIANIEKFQFVSFGGKVVDGENGKRVWYPDTILKAVPYDYMVPGYGTDNINTLRLWRSLSSKPFDLRDFNRGEYLDAAKNQLDADNISKVLYPEDSTPQGKRLRLQQQYFFVSASIKDIIAQKYGTSLDLDLSDFADRVAFQLNDTHPVIGIPELMRLLVDKYNTPWDKAWSITKNTFSYTCHTLLPEALEVWGEDLIGELLPRHLEIIKKINHEFIQEVSAKTDNNQSLIKKMSIIGEGEHRTVRMANLATVGGTMVNGVAELHSELLKDFVLKDFADYYPGKFTNVTNGVTPRRFMRIAQPELSSLISDAIGTDWLTNLDQLQELENFVNDDEFLRKFREVKHNRKVEISNLLQYRNGFNISPDSMYDMMVKRLHEYKRQILKLLHVISIYEKVKSGKVSADDIMPRTVIFGAKAAPGYKMAKEVIRLINCVSKKLSETPELAGKLAIAYPNNYNVTLAEKIIPSADLSEQISLAGKEASGTGNMKFALTGALTVGTLDGANVEIKRLVGDDNFFLFGMLEPEVARLEREGYNPTAIYESNEDLRNAINLIASGEFSDGDPDSFSLIVNDLITSDRFMALADFQSYCDIQLQIEATYRDERKWSQMSLLNIARCGYFSSDRAIDDYINRIWKGAKPIDIKPFVENINI